MAIQFFSRERLQIGRVTGACAILAAVVFAAHLSAAPVLAQGNKALMEEWARKKQQTKDEVYKELKRQGAVPRNGTITFEATVKPDPKKPDMSKVRIDSVVVKETPVGQKPQASDPVFGPREPGAGPARESGTIQTGTMRETITVTNGVPDYKPAPKGAKP